jgi:cytosine/adenosine deaminase-related metal-dependent hydrolase
MDGGTDAPPADVGPMDSTIGPRDSMTMPGDGSVVQTGDGILLRGVVLTPTGPLDPGEVFIVDDTIVCVAADCSAEMGAMDATIIDTGGVISPGLIDAHNHLPYDFLPEWVPGSLFSNRYEWADNPSYEAHIEPYTAHRSSGSHYCPGAKWGELRALIHGTTTIMGQSLRQGCIDRLVRNADHYHGFAVDHLRTTISSPRDITDSDADSYVADFIDPMEPVTRLAVHMGEGISGNNIDLEFSSFAGRDTRTNRHAGISLLEASDGSYRGTGYLIHAVALTDAELMEAASTDAKIVWSPSSNMVLYGQTADIGRILELGITVGIGPDWTLSGEDEMLSEMRFALEWATAESVPTITPEALWRMATVDGAEVVGLSSDIGSLEPGKRADVVVFGRVGPDPYLAVAESSAADVRLVLIDGEAYYGDLDFEMATSVNGDCDMIDACGTAKFLCVANTPGSDSRATETVEDIRTQLYNILEGIGYPPEEQYGRGDELLELVSCP